MRKCALLCILAACLVLATSVLAADARNTIRGGIVYSNPTGDGQFAPDPSHKFEADSAFGLGFSYERTITDLMGVNFDLSWFDHDVKISNVSEGDTFGNFSVMPLTVSLLFHPLEKGGVDFYIGPAVSYVMYGDLELEGMHRVWVGESELSVDSDFSLALQTGVDIRFNETWGMNVDLKYLDTKAKIDVVGEDLDLDVDPFLIGVGVTVRF